MWGAHMLLQVCVWSHINLFKHVADLGDVWSWGSGMCGQLGLGSEIAYFEPQKVCVCVCVYVE